MFPCGCTDAPLSALRGRCLERRPAALLVGGIQQHDGALRPRWPRSAAGPRCRLFCVADKGPATGILFGLNTNVIHGVFCGSAAPGGPCRERAASASDDSRRVLHDGGLPCPAGDQRRRRLLRRACKWRSRGDSSMQRSAPTGSSSFASRFLIKPRSSVTASASVASSVLRTRPWEHARAAETWGQDASDFTAGGQRSCTVVCHAVLLHMGCRLSRMSRARQICASGSAGGLTRRIRPEEGGTAWRYVLHAPGRGHVRRICRPPG